MPDRTGQTRLFARPLSTDQRNEIADIKARLVVLETQEGAAAGIADGSITDAKLRDSAGLSVIGRSANTTGAPADIIAANDHEVLRRSGTAVGFGTVATAGLANNAVSNAKLATMAQATVKGRAVAAGTGDPTDLSATQLNAIVASADLFHTNRIWSGVGSDEGRGQTGTPPLTVKGNSLLIYRESADSQPPNLEFLKRRSGSGTAVQSGDMLGSIVWTGADTTTFGAVGAIIRAEVDGTPGSADMPARIIFLTSADGSGTPSESFRVDSNQNIIVANNKRIETDEVRARDGGGLLLRDDGGNLGIFIEDATGNVGVLSSTPRALLHVGAGNAAPTSAAAIIAQRNANTAVAARHTGNSTEIFMLADNAGSMGMATNHALRIFAGAAERVRIDTAGNVGIGRTSPLHRLHVGPGGATLVTTSPTITTQIAGITALVLRNTSDNVEAFVQAAISDARVGTATNHPLLFRTNNSTRMALDTSGQLGIGTRSPQGLIHVHDGTSGWMYVTKTSVTTSQTVIPDGTGDILRAVLLDAVIWATDNTITDSIGGNRIARGGSLAWAMGGGNELTFTVSAGGALTVARTGGTKTYNVAMRLMWM